MGEITGADLRWWGVLPVEDITHWWMLRLRVIITPTRLTLKPDCVLGDHWNEEKRLRGVRRAVQGENIIDQVGLEDRAMALRWRMIIVILGDKKGPGQGVLIRVVHP